MTYINFKKPAQEQILFVHLRRDPFKITFNMSIWPCTLFDTEKRCVVSFTIFIHRLTVISYLRNNGTYMSNNSYCLMFDV